MGLVESTESVLADEKLIVDVTFNGDGQLLQNVQLTFSRDTDANPPSKEQYEELRNALSRFIVGVKDKMVHPMIRVTVKRTIHDGYAALGDEEYLRLRAEKIAAGLKIPDEGAKELPNIVRSNPIILNWYIPLHPDYRLPMARLLYRACVMFGIWVIIGSTGKLNENNVTARVLQQYMSKDGHEIMVNTRPVTDRRDNPGIYVTGGLNTAYDEDDVDVRVVLNTTIFLNEQKQVFEKGPNLLSYRFGHVAARMPNGDIVVAGGLDENRQFLVTCERLVAGGSAFEAIESCLSLPRLNAACTVTKHGLMVICGGELANGKLTDTIEVFDTQSDQFKLASVKMSRARRSHTVTAISDHEILVCGGFIGDGSKATGSTEIIDFNKKGPEAVRPVSSLFDARKGHCAVLLKDNTVLVVGGDLRGQETKAEIFNIATGIHEKFDIKSMFCHIQFASMMRSGKVIFGGGGRGFRGALRNTQIYRDADELLVLGPNLDGIREMCGATSY
jgi:hypothetical protein